MQGGQGATKLYPNWNYSRVTGLPSRVFITIEGIIMHTALIVICLVLVGGVAWAQVPPENNNADKPEYPTGRTVSPETKGQLQPQGWTGPINTTTGGTPASSPQGESPPGMQAAPEGSSKTVVAPEKDTK